MVCTSYKSLASLKPGTWNLKLVTPYHLPLNTYLSFPHASLKNLIQFL